MPKHEINMTGEKHGKLTVICDHSRDSQGRKLLCECECGNTTIVRMKNVRYGKTKSCGCSLNKGKKPPLKVRVDRSGKVVNDFKTYWGGGFTWGEIRALAIQQRKKINPGKLLRLMRGKASHVQGGKNIYSRKDVRDAYKQSIIEYYEEDIRRSPQDNI